MSAGEREAEPEEAGAVAATRPADPPERFAELLESGLALLEEELARGGAAAPAAAGRETATALLERAFALRADDPEVLHALGIAYGTRAIEALRANAAYPAGRAAAETHLQKAIFAFSRAAEVDPRAVESLNNLATMHALRGDREAAIEALKRSLQAHPDQPEVRERLEELGAF
jgi:Flp pilus assembly protein TadD